MARDYSGILGNAKWAYPLDVAMLSARILADFKGENLKVFHMSGGTALCDYNVLANAQNPTQARAAADEIGRQLRQAGHRIVSMEGYETADWILLDAGDVIVHVFQDPAREVYGLDTVFARNPVVSIPEEFYFGAARPAAGGDSDLKGYF